MEGEGDLPDDQLTASSSIDLNEDTTVKYMWRGTRKSLLLRYFVLIWRRLCEQEHLKLDEKEEKSIREELMSILREDEAETVISYIKRRAVELM